MTAAAPHADLLVIEEHLAFLLDGAPFGFAQVGSTAHRENDFRRENLPREDAVPWLAHEAAHGRSVYLVPGVFRDTHNRTTTGLVAVAAAVADVDDLDAEGARCRIAACPIQPQRVLQTSACGWQPIFLLDEGSVADLEAARAAQRGLADLLGGDAGALGLVQPFRVPGTLNRKPGRGDFLVRVADEMPCVPSARSTLADLDDLGILDRGRALLAGSIGTTTGDGALPSKATVAAWAERNRGALLKWLSSDAALAALWREGAAAVPVRTWNADARDWSGPPRRGLQAGQPTESHVDFLFALRLARLGFPLATDDDASRLAWFLFARRLRAGAKWKTSPWRTARRVRELVLSGAIPRREVAA